MLEYDTFDETPNLDILFADFRSICCSVIYRIKCLYAISDVDDCGNLLPHTSLVVLLFFLVVIIISFNGISILFRLIKLQVSKSKDILALGTLLLHLLDVTSVIYLVGYGGSHINYLGKYIEMSYVWKSSVICKLLGSQIWLLMQMSSVMLFGISLNKLYLVWKPFEPPPIRPKHYTCLFSVFFIIFLLQAILHNIYFVTRSNNFCLPMKFESIEGTATVINMSFILIQEIINILVMILVFVLTLWMIHLAKQSRIAAGRQESDKDKSFTRHNIVMSCTNFLQWLVIFPVSALSASGYKIEPKVLAWLVIMGLPVNSIVNPILYTISTTQFKDWILRKKE